MICKRTIRATNSLFTSQQKTTLLQRRNEARHRDTLARTFVIVDIKLIWEGEKDLDRPQHRPAIRRRELRLPNQLLLRAYESHGSVQETQEKEKNRPVILLMSARVNTKRAPKNDGRHVYKD